jgi:hypothetical protein
MTRIQSKAFAERWTKMLERYRIEPPLHMTEFSRGKYAGWYPEMKRAVFLDASKLINEHKLYSLSVAISQEDFKSELTEEVRKVLIGPYRKYAKDAIEWPELFSVRQERELLAVAPEGIDGILPHACEETHDELQKTVPFCDSVGLAIAAILKKLQQWH